MTEPKLRVLICDDSAVVRGLLTKAVETDPGIEVAGTAMHGEAALLWLSRHSVDVMICDVEMPVMDGLETLRNINQSFSGLPVIMASALTYAGGEATVKALALGAAACVAKPQASSAAESIRQLSIDLVPLVIELGNAARKAVTPPTSPSISAYKPKRITPEVLVIGSSTGGPRALEQVLMDIPSAFTPPILIVQHMPPLFTPMLARHLAQDTSHPCQEGSDGIEILKNNVYVAPGDSHMVLERTSGQLSLALTHGAPVHFCRPSVNPLFQSAARVCGENVLALMLTGMGSDGLEGTEEIANGGGYVIAQDEASSTVWGMPGAITRAGLAHQVLPLRDIGSTIAKLCRTPSQATLI